MDDDWETMADAAPVPTFENEDTGFDAVDDDWDAEPSAAPKAAAPAAAPKAAPKKTAKQLAKEKEALEAAERAQAAAAARRRDEAARAEQVRMRDPEYARKKRLQEQADIERAEVDLAADLFGDSPAPAPAAAAKPAEPEAEVNPVLAERARLAAEIAARSGLMDGADNMDAINDPDARTGPAAPPSALDVVRLDSKEDGEEFAKILARKLNDLNNSAVSLAVLRSTFQSVGPQMKLDDVNDLLRAVTVLKNDMTKALQNKKKKSAKPQLKSGGKGGAAKAAQGGFDDNYGDDYDDDYDRNGPDADFF